MDTGSAEIRDQTLHNQAVRLPNLEAWHRILEVGSLDGLPVSLPDHVAGWLAEYAKFEVAHLGLIPWKEKWLPLSLLRLADRYYRVHYEDVICQHCDRRCGPSATPDTVSYAFGGISTAQAWEEFKGLPVQSCPHCHGLLSKRQTVWLAYPHGPQVQP